MQLLGTLDMPTGALFLPTLLIELDFLPERRPELWSVVTAQETFNVGNSTINMHGALCFTNWAYSWSYWTSSEYKSIYQNQA